MASQGKAIGIVAWILVVVLLIGIGGLAFLNRQEAGRAAGLADALLKAGTAAGVEGLAPESLKNAATLPDILQQMETAIQGARMELASTKDALAAAQTEASGAKTESASLSQRVQEQTAKMEALSKDLTAKEEVLAAAKIEAEQAGQEAQDARRTAEKQKAELEGSIESLKAQMAEESARLQTELDAARQQIQVRETEASPAEEQSSEEEIPAEAGEGEAAEMPVQAAAAVEEPMPELEAEVVEGRIIGQSKMFSVIRDSGDGFLSFRLLDGQELKYQGVPSAVVGQLAAAGDTLDMKYRFQIQSKFKSIPPDSIVVRKYWKWNRRHRPAFFDVRLIEPEASPAAEAAPIEEQAPVAEEVQAPAAEAAPAGE